MANAPSASSNPSFIKEYKHFLFLYHNGCCVSSFDIRFLFLLSILHKRKMLIKHMFSFIMLSSTLLFVSLHLHRFVLSIYIHMTGKEYHMILCYNHALSRYINVIHNVSSIVNIYLADAISLTACILLKLLVFRIALFCGWFSMHCLFFMLSSKLVFFVMLCT